MASEFSNGWASQQKKRFVVVLPDEVDVAFMALGEPRGGTETGFTLREDLSFSTINLKAFSDFYRGLRAFALSKFCFLVEGTPLRVETKI